LLSLAGENEAVGVSGGKPIAKERILIAVIPKIERHEEKDPGDHIEEHLFHILELAAVE
jgi:hypothetical protein